MNFTLRVQRWSEGQCNQINSSDSSSFPFFFLMFFLHESAIAFNIYIVIMQVQWYYMWLAVVKTSWDFISEVNFHGCILFKVLFILSKFTCYVSCFCVSLVPFVLYIVKFKFVDFWNSCILLSRENKMSIYPRKKKKKKLKIWRDKKKRKRSFLLRTLSLSSP